VGTRQSMSSVGSVSVVRGPAVFAYNLYRVVATQAVHLDYPLIQAYEVIELERIHLHLEFKRVYRKLYQVVCSVYISVILAQPS
jgi:hypothetical protein